MGDENTAYCSLRAKSSHSTRKLLNGRVEIYQSAALMFILFTKRLTAIPSKPEFGAARVHGREVIEGGVNAAPEYGIAVRVKSLGRDCAADGK